jgi:GNAT superfamily N-acetyltransferase
MHDFILCDRVRDDDTARRGFLSLAKMVFGLDFAPWLEGGWWGGDYIPHALMDGDKVAANVSANLIRSCWRGESKRFVQLGTVMTDPACRGQGLARRLMEEVVARYGRTATACI